MIFLLVILILLFGVVFVLVDRWENLKRQLIPRFILLLLILAGLLVGLRYWLVSSIGCIPNCVGASLVGRDLAGFDLKGAKLIEANLSGATLAGANLENANLSGADLSQANLENANLQNAKLLGATLQRANLTGANLTNSDLSGANLTAADLTGITLTQTTLDGVRLNNVDLVGADLTGAQLVAVELVGAKMNGAKLINADLSGATLSRADLSGAQLNGSNLSGAWLNLALLIGADLSNADLSGASLIGADLASADLSESRLVGVNLVGANLAGANFNGANLKEARLTKSEMVESDERDLAVKALTELQRGLILVDRDLGGITFNSQTVWPNPTVAISMTSNEDEENLVEAETTIKVGILHSLTGDMAISEIAVKDAIQLAIDEINAAGGVLDQPIESIIEDGASDPVVFAEKARKLLETDQVTVIFGGWTSASRKAMLPVLQELDGLLFYPLQYEGFESSLNVFYIGAEPSQQIIPAVNFLISQGYTNTLLIGSDSVFPHTANEIIKAQLGAAGISIAGAIYVPSGQTDFTQLLSQLKAAPPDSIINTLNGTSNIAFFKQLSEAGFSAETLPVLSLSVAEEEIRTIGPELMADHLTAWNYYQTLETPENFAFVNAYKTAYGADRVTSDPVEAGYVAVHLWKLMVEAANSTEPSDVRQAAASGEIEFLAPEGLVRVDGKTQHVYKTARIGRIRGDDGLINTVSSSEAPIKPDPYLTQFPWATEVRKWVEEQQKAAAEQENQASP